MPRNLARVVAGPWRSLRQCQAPSGAHRYESGVQIKDEIDFAADIAAHDALKRRSRARAGKTRRVLPMPYLPLKCATIPDRFVPCRRHRHRRAASGALRDCPPAERL